MSAASNLKKKPARNREDGPDPVDVHVGKRLRLQRNLIGMSQEQLGRASSLTFQQIHKYERGANRVSASRMHQLAQLLGVPVAYFFEGLPSAAIAARGGFSDAGQESLDGGQTAQNDGEMIKQRETLELIRAYYRITDPKQRRKVYELIKSMADEKAG